VFGSRHDPIVADATAPDVLGVWDVVVATDMRPLVGHTFTFKAEPTPWWDGIVRCEVSCTSASVIGGGAARSRRVWDTVVTWTLTPTPSRGTRLALPGATASHIASGDDVRHILTPLALAVLVVASWALRPEGRKLKRPTTCSV
jgi:hypothetical protein